MTTAEKRDVTIKLGKETIQVSYPVFHYDKLDEESVTDMCEMLAVTNHVAIQQLTYKQFCDQSIIQHILNSNECIDDAAIYEDEHKNLIGIVYDIVDHDNDRLWMMGSPHRVNLGGKYKKKISDPDKAMWLVDELKHRANYYRGEGVDVKIIIRNPNPKPKGE